MGLESDQIPLQGHRTLAAIVFSDVVNFGGIMSADEEHALKLVQRDVELMTRVCEQHEGRVLKFTGDGLLMYFHSAVQAVACALETQKAIAAAAADLPSEDILQHRIGIHLGDVFVSDDDVMGDGVNIAARLQSEAEPGGICLSQIVYDVVKKRIALQATYLGPRELKHIQEAVPIYQIVLAAHTKTTLPDESARLTREMELEPDLIEPTTISRESFSSPPTTISGQPFSSPPTTISGQPFSSPPTTISREPFSSPPTTISGQPFSSPVKPEPLRLAEETRKELERILTRRIGPIAAVILQQTLNQVVNYQELVNRLVTHLPEAEQFPFRESAHRLLQRELADSQDRFCQHSVGAEIPYQTTTAPQPNSEWGGVAAIDREFVKRCERELAKAIGPIAIVIVQRTLAQQPNLSRPQLVASLAKHLTNPQAIQAFHHQLL
ncbi:hypothetical protein K9N68_27620 [Kovacikia minuta CCNUW1]|uniref:adenylate/guanylate cyclase domain-containing protein n=1 Tax=Kovacikia minuta TaxID=2931930 RepID=UPI001CCDE79F|nr:adenylate/guanylate cyclase domain-containing protein [Kovacikia minuta]UBF25340.1 hypothetical protein K9N68_27620 [Kovacikia minuta CCNUW1]